MRNRKKTERKLALRHTQSAFRAASEHHHPQKAGYTQLLQREFDTRLREVGQRTAKPA
jgi:hypothetical protein